MLRKLSLLLLLATAPALAQDTTFQLEKPTSQMPASGATAPGTPAPVPGAFTLAVMPDTQFYAELHPEIFHQQTQWIADNATAQNIQFVIQLGDVTQNSAPVEWEVAKDSFKTLEGKVPWASAPGNHDYGGNLQIVARRSPFSSYLPPATFLPMPTFGGFYDKQPDRSENQWHHFQAGGRQWLYIGLEFAPRADVLRWANDVITAHPDHSAVLFTHGYLDPRTNQHIKLAPSAGKPKPGQAPQPKPPGQPDISQGEDIWQKVVSKHPNVVMVICGHAGYTNHTSRTADPGQTVQEMVVDYQGDINGGNGWMRLLQFLPDGKTVRCRDFSPTLDKTSTMPDRTYDFEVAMPAK